MEKILIITGASRGIGAATALLVAKWGYTICVNYHRNQKVAHQIVDAIQRHQ